MLSISYGIAGSLRCDDQSIASNIYIQYSFDVVTNTFATGKGPEHDRAHDINLAKDICDGESLEIPNDFTQN